MPADVDIHCGMNCPAQGVRCRCPDCGQWLCNEFFNEERQHNCPVMYVEHLEKDGKITRIRITKPKS